MSRLYDRVLAQGCRPLSAQDVWDVAWEVDENRATFRRFVEDMIGRPPTDAELAERGVRIRKSLEGSKSADVLSREEIEDAVVISAEEVADYFASLSGDKDFDEILDRVAPPFPRMFIEFQRRRNTLHLESWGVFLSGDRDESGEGWRVLTALVGEWKQGRPVGPIARSGVGVHATGLIRTSSDTARALFPEDELRGRRLMNLWPVVVGVPDLPEELSYTFAASSLELLAPALFAVSLMHCKNVALRGIDPPERLSKSHAKKTGHPLTRYYILDITPMRRILDTEGEAQAKGLRHALHICRGHFKTFTEDAPLFGRHVGTYWWPSHARGSADEGVIGKDYRLRLGDDAFGTGYRHADENVTVQPGEGKRDNPDTSERGLRAHNRTQNLLARAVEEAGFRPRSPKAGEPDFDIAWEEDDVIWVAEVKSTTESTEERQMRLAIGQVIRYRQQLSREGREARAMIAVENAPYDESWIDLCGREGIALVWPEVMSQALSDPRPSA